MTNSDKRNMDIARGDVPKAVVSRLSLYLRELQYLLEQGQETISSTKLGKLLEITDAQVRKDLAYFGQFGYPGIGYRCHELITAIRQILGTDRNWPVALVGVGNLGRALLGYRGFFNQGFRIEAAFDSDPHKQGKTIEGITISRSSDLKQVIMEKGIKLGMISVPQGAAQEAADALIEAGITGIVNFAPVTLNLPAHVHHVGVDLAIELEQLTFAVANQLNQLSAEPEQS